MVVKGVGAIETRIVKRTAGETYSRPVGPPEVRSLHPTSNTPPRRACRRHATVWTADPPMIRDISGSHVRATASSHGFSVSSRMSRRSRR